MSDAAAFYVSVGDVVAGKYLVEHELGRGGMAVVLAARHVELDERFALKFLARDFVTQPAVALRFAREAKAACRIRSEHVARVHDVGTHEGAPFIVMEHLTGRDLGTVLAEGGPLPIEEAVEYAMQACEALAAAHAQGIVHRDIKPENLFLVEHDGLPMIKLLDFGISKVALGCSEGPSRLTGDLSMGTPCYMAPEQIRSTASADAKSDQWSLGVVLYELLTGRQAFDAESVTELCAAVLEQEATPIRELRPDVPEALADVIARCMAKDPDERFADVAELAAALLPSAPSRALVSVERSSTLLASARRASGRQRLSPVPPASDRPLVADVRTSSSERRVRAWPRVASIVALVVLAATALALVAVRTRSAATTTSVAAAAPDRPADEVPATDATRPDAAITVVTVMTGTKRPAVVPAAAAAPSPPSSAKGHKDKPAPARSATATASASSPGSATAGATASAPAAATIELGY